jgi:hypothetical protein
VGDEGSSRRSAVSVGDHDGDGLGAKTPGPSRLRRLLTGARSRDALPWWVLGGGLVVSAVMWLILNSRLWFFYDTWGFILNRVRVSSPDLALWQPSNEHWSTLPILLFRLMFSVFGLKHHLPYVVPLLAMHLVICVIIAWMLRRNGVSRWTVVGVTLILGFLGAGAENLEWEFQTGFVGSVMFGLLSLVVLSRGRTGRWRIVGAWVLMTAGLMCSGVGVTMVGCAALLVLLRRGVVKAAIVASVPVVVFSAWYATFGRYNTQAHPSVKDLGRLPRYVWTGLTSPWETTTGIPGSGALIILVIVGVVLLSGRRHPLAAVLAVGAVAQLTISGFVRVQYGVDQAAASRYAYLICIYTSVAVGIAVDAVVRRLGRPRWFTCGLMAGLCLAVMANGVALAHEYMAWQLSFNKERDTVLGAIAVSDSGQRILSDIPDVGFASITLTGALAIRDELPNAQPSPQGYVDVASVLLVGQGSAVDDLPLAKGISVFGLSTIGTASAGCQQYVPTSGEERIALSISQQGGRVVLTVPAPNIKTRLEYGSVFGEFTDRTLPAGQPVSVGTTSRGGILDIYVPAGSSVSVCAG